MEDKKEYHILSLSGGKDSAALALYIKENYPNIHKEIQYYFCDTELELPELYDYLNKLEIFLGKKITRLKPPVSFQHIYETRNILPTPQNRWCTVELKTKTIQNMFRTIINNENCKHINLYIGIRADEPQRVKTATSNKPYIKERFLFVEDGLIKKDIYDILNNSGIGFPEYMKWKSRSGCFFCFYQSKLEWLNLYEHHPELYKKAMEYEYKNCKDIKKGHFGWRSDITLEDMIKPENIKAIRKKYSNKKLDKEAHFKNLLEIY